VTVTVNVPAGVAAVVAIVSVDVPVLPGVKLMLVGLNVNVIPVAAGATVAESGTLPVKPKLLAVIVEVAEPPAVKLAGVAVLAVRLKSEVMVKGVVTLWLIEPLAAVIVTM
jgi:hypothetical protein